MSAIVNAYFHMDPPILTGAASDKLFRVAGIATGQVADVPESWRGSFMFLSAEGCSGVQFGFTLDTGPANGPTLVKDQAAAIGTGHLAAGGKIHDNTTVRVLVPRNARKFCYVCGAAAGFFSGVVGSPKALAGQ